MNMKVWLITGSNRGLGRAFANEAAERGNAVIAAARKIDENDTFYKKENVLPVLMDVTNAAQVSEAVQKGTDRFGRIDILVNNAGFGMNGAFEEISDEELRTLFETDYFGVVNVIKAVLPIMRKQKSGRILNVSSQAGMMGMAGCTPYNAAKFAVVGLSEGLNEELKPWNIKAAAVCPGSFRTDFRDKSSLKTPAHTMPEYDGTAAHDVLKFLAENNHKQQGDPERAAKFIYDLVTGDEMPSHILIGKICCDAVKASLKRTINEIDSYYAESGNTDFADWSGKAF